MNLLPVLWVCGPPGVGKTAVGWEIFSQLSRDGVAAGYLDIDQLGMCYPAQAEDPARHRLKARNLAAMVATYRGAGAQCLVVSGVVDVDNARMYADRIPGAEVTLCRLRVEHNELRERLAERAWRSEMVAEAVEEAVALDDSDVADVCIDTSGLPVLEATRLVRERAGGWPILIKRLVGETKAPVVSTSSGSVLWLCGATGVGKSSVGWQLFRDVVSAGTKAAFVDLDQVGFVRPVPAGDPANHRVKAYNLAAMWQTFRADGARCLIVVGPIDSNDAIRAYTDALPATTWTLVRLHAGPGQLTERIMRRQHGRPARLAGDPLKGQPAATLRRIANEAVAKADDLERAQIGDLRINSDDLTIDEIAQHVRARWPEPSSMHHQSSSAV